MSTQRFTPEFKEEAVKQVRDRGYGVPGVAARIGVSAHSLYKWVKAASPDKSEQQSKEMRLTSGFEIKPIQRFSPTDFEKLRLFMAFPHVRKPFIAHSSF